MPRLLHHISVRYRQASYGGRIAGVYQLSTWTYIA